jgi:hypothetical protein
VRARDLTSDAHEAALSPWREPGMLPRKSDDSVALYRSRALDAFTRSHPLIPYVSVLPFAMFCAFRARVSMLGEGLLFFTIGWLGWSLLEYAMHRFLFHANVRRESLRIATFLAHGYHHVWPDDPRRITATPLQITSVVLLLSGIFHLAFDEARAWAALSGAMIGFVAYEAVHWMCHHGEPKVRVLRALKQHHMRHHHIAPHTRFGIGTPLWDWIFRTSR